MPRIDFSCLFSLLPFLPRPFEQNVDDQRLNPGQLTPGYPESVTVRSVDGAVDEKNPKRQSQSFTEENKKQDDNATDVSHAEDREEHYVTGIKLVLIFVGMLLSIFLVALDQTIVATAIPRIASDFDALEQVTWIASGYFLTQSGLILTYGQLLAVANTKYVYLMAVTLFEIGSLICGGASLALVVVRYGC